MLPNLSPRDLLDPLTHDLLSGHIQFPCRRRFYIVMLILSMGVDMEELIIIPFQEVVDRGTDAVANGAASDNERMLRAAQALVKEGERALKRLKPLWNGQVEKYGDSFRDTILEQGIDGRVESRLTRASFLSISCPQCLLTPLFVL
jgi:hypothetical protein